MKTSGKLFFVMVILFASQAAYGQTVDEYIKKAEGHNQSGNLEQAVKVMEEAIQKYPYSSTAHSYLGLYRGTQAGQTQDFMEAGRLIGIAYEMLDKAVSLDPNNPIARFHRGLMGVKVPAFLNRLDQGIEDLEFLTKIHEESPDAVSSELLASAYNFLGEGYQKEEKGQKAVAAWEKVIELAPGTAVAEDAQKNLSKTPKPMQAKPVEQEKYTLEDPKKLKEAVDEEPDNSKLLTRLGKAYFDAGNFEEAEKALRKAIQKDSTNVGAYKLLIQTIGEMVTKGYDERIYDDTNFLADIAFEVTKLLDKAVEIAPDDVGLRLIRGRSGVMMPFFVGKLEQAVEDLELVRHSDASDESKAEALYWLGMAHQKKATTNWIKVVTDYPNTNASKLAFESMRPSTKHFDPTEYEAPFLLIDFILGFRDELAPQTAVWIEEKNGSYVKTVYVSGFSGFAKGKQVNLPKWSKSSEFRDVDAVTSASIDVGHHIYVWDLKNGEGKKVKPGEYVVKVETSYWPSMEYQAVSAGVTIGRDNSRTAVEEGNLIPYLEVKYYSAVPTKK